MCLRKYCADSTKIMSLKQGYEENSANGFPCKRYDFIGLSLENLNLVPFEKDRKLTAHMNHGSVVDFNSGVV